MEKIDIIDGRFTIPEKHILSKDKKRMTIKTPWSSEVHRLDKDCWHTSIQQWFRSKKMGDKPYIPEGFIDIDGERYIANVIKPHTQGNPTDSSHNRNLTEDFSKKSSQMVATQPLR